MDQSDLIMKGEKTHRPTLGEKTLDLISGLFSKPRNAPEKTGPHGDETRSVESSFGSKRREIKRDESSRAFYRELTSELEKSDLAASNLQVLGLNELRKKVGDQWDKHRRVIQTVIEGTLGKALTPEDRYWRLDDELYIIAFDDTDIVSTVRRTEAIGAAIVKQLVGTESGSLVSVQALTGKLALATNGTIEFSETAAPDEDAAGAGRKTSPRVTDVPPGKSNEIAFASWAKTLRSREHTEELEKILREASNAREQRLETSAITPRPSTDDLEQVLLAAQEAQDARAFIDYSIGFSPIWDSKKNAIATYCVLPYYRGQNRWYLEHAVLDDATNAEEVLDLDIACLRTAIRETAKSYTANSAVMTISQLHYMTISSAKGLAQVLHECARVPKFLQKYLAVQLVGMPAELPSPILIATIAKLHRYFRLIAVRTTPRVPLAQIKSSGFDLATFALDDNDPSPLDNIAFQRALNEARTLSLPVIVENVSSIETASRLAALGVTYLAGLAISTPLESPRGLIWCDIRNLPLEMLETRSPGHDGVKPAPAAR